MQQFEVRQATPGDLDVLKVNVDARRLYERLGFRVTCETETHFRMRAEKTRPDGRNREP